MKFAFFPLCALAMLAGCGEIPPRSTPNVEKWAAEAIYGDDRHMAVIATGTGPTREAAQADALARCQFYGAPGCTLGESWTGGKCRYTVAWKQSPLRKVGTEASYSKAPVETACSTDGRICEESIKETCTTR